MPNHITILHVDREVPLQRTVIHHILFDIFTLIPQRDEKIIMSIPGIMFHNMPEYWHSTNFHHRLGLDFGFFRQSCTHTTCQYSYFTRFSPNPLTFYPNEIQSSLQFLHLFVLPVFDKLIGYTSLDAFDGCVHISNEGTQAS